MSPAGAIGGAEAVLATWASFTSLVPKAYSKDELTARGSPTGAQADGPSYNHPIHGYNKAPAGPQQGPQGAMFGNAPSAPRYYDDAA